MAKNSFKIRIRNYWCKTPVNWMLTLADVPKEFIEEEIESFAEALRDEKFKDEDFVTKLI